MIGADGIFLGWAQAAVLVVLAGLLAFVLRRMSGAADLSHAKAFQSVTKWLTDESARLGVPVWLAAIGGVLWAGLVLVLTGGLFLLLLLVLRSNAPVPGDPEAVAAFRIVLVQLVALTGVLGAVVALPVTLSRLRLTRAQTRIAEESLFNDKITAAAGDLHARRQRTLDPEDAGTRRDVWEDDIGRRIAAIDRLEGLVVERPATAERVMRLLSAYLRETSREIPAETHPYLNTQWRMRAGPLSEEEARGRLNLSEDESSLVALTLWTRGLTAAREDMEIAAQTLGRLGRDLDLQTRLRSIDLRGANLQGMALRKAHFNGANLFGAKLHGADLFGAELHGAYLFGAELHGANLFGAELHGAHLGWAELHGADLGWAEFDAMTDLSRATLRGARVRSVDFRRIPQIVPHLDGMFGDGSVTLPEGVPWPETWPRHELDLADFAEEWRKFRADPDAYTPPPAPDGGAG